MEVPILKTSLLNSNFLFVGYSFADELILKQLSQIRQCLGNGAPCHYSIEKRETDPVKKARQEAFILDLHQRYRIITLLVDRYEDIPLVIEEINKKREAKNVFISGSLSGYNDVKRNEAYELCSKLGKKLIQHGYNIYSGRGNIIGSFIIGDAVCEMGERFSKVNRINVHPFSKDESLENKNSIRAKLIDKCETAIFLYGMKAGGELSTGTLEEFNICTAKGKNIIVIGVKQDSDDAMYASDILYEFLDNPNTTPPTKVPLSRPEKHKYQTFPLYDDYPAVAKVGQDLGESLDNSLIARIDNITSRICLHIDSLNDKKHGVFVAYKHQDRRVGQLPDSKEGTPRDYVDHLEKILDSNGFFYTGEARDQDLRLQPIDEMRRHLFEKIDMSSLAVVLVSPGMSDKNAKECQQWIPQEISYALSKSSGPCGILCIELPDKSGSYEYASRADSLFSIISQNKCNLKENESAIEDSYIITVKWKDFIKKPGNYLVQALQQHNESHKYDIHSSLCIFDTPGGK